MAVIATTHVSSDAGYAQKIDAGGHALTADEPESAGGTNTGPAPYGLLLSALGACTSITLRMYADKKGWELGKISVELRHIKTHDGGEHIEREIRCEGPLSDEQLSRIADIAERTPVTKTLKTGTAIKTRFL